jgi:hydroxymethylpyrimidine pyrophosphatase-like HAD family hydrolase
MTDFEKRVDNLVDTLGCSLKEAEEIIKADEEIDKGAKLFEQTAEQKQASKQYRQGERKTTVYKLDKRERKADEDKRKLVELIAAAVAMVTENAPTVTNVERQIDFEFNGRKFRVVLSAPRS